MTVLLLVAVAVDLARQALARWRDPIGTEWRRQPITGRASTPAADDSLARLDTQTRHGWGLNFATPVPTCRFA